MWGAFGPLSAEFGTGRAYDGVVALLRYSLLRLGLVVAVWAIFRFVFQVDGLLPVVLAFVIAFLIAFIAFPRSGDAAASQLETIVTGRGRKSEEPGEYEVLEDAIVDELVEEDAASEDEAQPEKD